MDIGGLRSAESLLDMKMGGEDTRRLARTVITQSAARSLICSLAIRALYMDGEVPEEADEVMPAIADVLADVYNDSMTAQNMADF
ncbi:hypothetical protein H6A18_09435 [Collinsella tanakaei]|uniref:hypothetical protein n=1 Tax=Collinsella tanakaei TaxID=626935 RepID=UPI00195AF229|nr:hypothetical protein [Collinsella tanakaei]MBM6756723.1 hypothetical protein [Collinsella tanakaei]